MFFADGGFKMVQCFEYFTAKDPLESNERRAFIWLQKQIVTRTRMIIHRTLEHVLVTGKIVDKGAIINI